MSCGCFLRCAVAFRRWKQLDPQTPSVPDAEAAEAYVHHWRRRWHRHSGGQQRATWTTSRMVALAQDRLHWYGRLMSGRAMIMTSGCSSSDTRTSTSHWLAEPTWPSASCLARRRLQRGHTLPPPPQDAGALAEGEGCKGLLAMPWCAWHSVGATCAMVACLAPAPARAMGPGGACATGRLARQAAETRGACAGAWGAEELCAAGSGCQLATCSS